MTKRRVYESSFKLKMVNESLVLGKSVKSISRENGFCDSLLRRWIDHYNQYGVEGLGFKPKQKYSNDYKLVAVLDFLDNRLTLRECCYKYKIPSFGTLCGWLAKYDRQGTGGFDNQTRRDKIMVEKAHLKKIGRQLSREELEKENLYLRAENEFLKKLEALTAKKKRKK